MSMQRIRLSQIKSNIAGVNSFEDQLNTIQSIREETFVATEGQTSLTLSADYRVGYNQLVIYLNGLRLTVGGGFTELNSRSIVFDEPLMLGDLIIVRVGAIVDTVVTKPIDIFRESFVISAGNASQIQFVTANLYRIGLNTLEIHIDGVLAQLGSDKDYIEIDNKTFKFNYTLPIGTLISTKITAW